MFQLLDSAGIQTVVSGLLGTFSSSKMEVEQEVQAAGNKSGGFRDFQIKIFVCVCF